MIISSQKSQNKKILITIAAFLFLAVVVVLNKDSFPVKFIQGLSQTLFSIPKSTIYAVGKSESNNDPKLLKKIKDLEKKIVDYELLKQDNIALKSQFLVSGDTSQNLIAAKIIGIQGSHKNPVELIINAGEKSGVKKGMTVEFEKYFVGKVEKVTSQYSVILTPYNSNLRVLAKYPKSNASGIVFGQKDFILFDGVIITDTLEKDGIIVTKGEVDKNGVGIVPDLLIGKISSISKNETAPFQSAEIESLVDFSKLSNVFVVSQM